MLTLWKQWNERKTMQVWMNWRSISYTKIISKQITIKETGRSKKAEAVSPSANQDENQQTNQDREPPPCKKGSGRLTFRSSLVKLLPPGKESCFFLFSRLQSSLSLSTFSTLLCFFLFRRLQSRVLTFRYVGGGGGGHSGWLLWW